MNELRARATVVTAWGRRVFLLTPVLLLSVSLAVYWPHLDDFFALDDYVWLQAASTGDVLGYLRRAFSFPPGTPFDLPTPFWRPLVDSYFLVAWRLFALDPVPYHVANVALHALNATLLAVLLRHMGAPRATGVVAAFLFLLLPTYGYAVTWISEVTELLAACFCLASLVAFCAYLRGGPRRTLFYAGALPSFLLALLAKESSVTLPAVMAGLTLALLPPRSADGLRRRVWELAPFGGLAAAYFAFLYVQEYGAVAEGGLYSFGSHFFGNMWEYVKWMTFPFPEAEIGWAPHLRVATAAALIAVAAWALAGGRRIPAFLFSWVVATLLPYAFFETGTEARYTYAASLPLAGLAALALSAALGGMTRRVGLLPSFSLAAGVLLVGSVFLAGEVRNHQEWMRRQAEAYSQLFHEVPLVCGRASPGRIYLLGSPVFDYHGTSTSMALNMVYEDVFVVLLEKGASLPADLSRGDCVLAYSGGRYVEVAVR